MKKIMVALVVALCSAQEGHSAIKKGVADTSSQPAMIEGLRVGWYYNWNPQPTIPGKIAAEFVPMIWGAKNADDATLGAIKNNPNYRELLGFNEPDSETQSAMTVDQAIALWPKLMATGKRLGSPAVTKTPGGRVWLEQFMTRADALGYRVDFVCAHWYDDVTSPDAADSVVKYLTRLHAAYHRPVWLTEFAGGEWDFISVKPLTRQHNIDFMARVLPRLERLPFVERYAWFATLSDFGEFEPYYKPSSLYDSASKTLTPVGQAYRDFNPDSLIAAPSELRILQRSGVQFFDDKPVSAGH